MKFLEWLKSLFAGIRYSPAVVIENVAPVKLTPKEWPWMKVAKAELGVKEMSGKKHNPRIVEYHAATTLKASEDEVPWCASFVNWVFLQCSMRRTKSARAASWLLWGVPCKPRYGCVVVKSRPLNGSPTGGNHVTFWLRAAKKNGVPGYIGLGGNQSNEVNETWYPDSTVKGYRWPEEYKDV